MVQSSPRTVLGSREIAAWPIKDYIKQPFSHKVMVVKVLLTMPLHDMLDTPSHRFAPLISSCTNLALFPAFQLHSIAYTKQKLHFAWLSNEAGSFGWGLTQI